MRYRDLEYNLASRTLGTPTLKNYLRKNILPQLVSVIVTQNITSYQALFLTKLSFPSSDLVFQSQFQVWDG